MKKVAILLTILFAATLFGQEKETETIGVLTGRWEGAFIKANAHQAFELEFFERGGEFLVNQVIPDLHPVYGNVDRKVSVDANGSIKTETTNGDVVLTLDSDRLELTGTIVGSNPIIYLHLKKVPDRPAVSDFQKIAVKSRGATISGHLHTPLLRSSKTAIIIAEGRGCYANRTDRNLYARFLVKYGVSVLAFHKRGNGDSTGNCDTATIGDLAGDVDLLRKFLKKHSANFENIGVIGSSAGAWVVQRANEIEPFDFIITVNGPSTSVREQQYQSMENGFREFNLGKTGQKQVAEYTDLVFDGLANQATLDRLTKLLKSSEQQGWSDFLDATDKTDTVAGIETLWVRRHEYDPADMLKSFEGKYLAVFGEKDWIVPIKENTEALEAAFQGSRRSKLTIAGAFGADHGMGIRSEFVKLNGNNSYWQFYKTSPVVKLSILEFLKHNRLL